MRCDACDYETIYKHNFDRHIKSSKHQKRMSEHKKLCTKCGKKFSRADSLKRHKNTCHSNLSGVTLSQVQQLLEEARNNDLKEMKDLIDKIENKKPDVPVNNVQQMEPLSIGKIADSAIEHLNIEDLEKGIDAVVEFASTFPLKNNVICMDRSRRKFKYINEAGETVVDYGGVQLSTTVFKGIQNRCNTLIDNKYEIMMAQVQSAVDLNEGYREDVWENLNKGSKLQDFRLQMNDAAEGKENELQRSFARKLAKKF